MCSSPMSSIMWAVMSSIVLSLSCASSAEHINPTLSPLALLLRAHKAPAHACITPDICSPRRGLSLAMTGHCLQVAEDRVLHCMRTARAVQVP